MGTENITKSWLERIAADERMGKPAALPAGVERVQFFDTQLPGFGVLVGKRFATFFVRHRVNGAQRMITIGRFGRPGAGEDHDKVWTVERARKEAIRLLGAMEQGIEPAPERLTTTKTLRDAFDEHISSLRKKAKAGKRSEATIATFEKSMRYIGHLLDKPITEVTGEVLRELHETIKREAKPRANAKNERGAALANRVITNIGTAWGTLNKRLEGKLGNWNPAQAVDKETLVPKRVVVVDLPGWYARVTGKDSDGNHHMRNPIQRDGLVFALFTGLRSEDVRTARFENYNADRRTLALPDPKGGASRSFEIPLSKRCRDIIERRKSDNARDLGRDDGDDGWIFPAVDADGDVGPIGDLRQQVHHLGRHSRYPVEDVHTLRRTYTSAANDAGVSELDQHVLTNHKFATGNVHRTYIAQHLDHLLACQERIAAKLEERLKPTPRPRADLRIVRTG